MNILRRIFGSLSLRDRLPAVAPGWERALDDLRTEIEALRAAQANLAQLPTEWAEMLDKLNRWSAREAARLRRDTARNLDGPEAPPETTRGPQMVIDPTDKASLRAAMARGQLRKAD